jgi:NADH-quinone oxidoreductase subunit C
VFQLDPERNQFVVRKLTERFKVQIVLHEVLADMLCITVAKVGIPDVLQFLRDDDELQFNFLTTLCGMHYSEKDQLGIVYHLHSFKFNHRIRIKSVTAVADPTFASATALWPAADWMERETFDFYGIQFEGHPNLRRILNVDDMIGFPMRKEFPLEDQTRKDKDDSMFGRK